MELIIKKEDALAAFHTQTALADALGINQAAIAQWGEYMPELRAHQLLRIKADIAHSFQPKKRKAA